MIWLAREPNDASADPRIAELMDKHNAARTARDADVPGALVELGQRLAQAERQRIQVEDRRHPRRMGLRVALATAACVAVASAVVAISVALDGEPAAAATPQPLSFTSPTSTQRVVAHATDRLAEDDGVDVPSRSVRSVAWGIVIDDGALRPPVIPQFISLDWDEDQSGTSVIVEGRTERTTAAQVGRVLATDEVLSEQTYGPGEFGVPSAALPPESDTGVRGLLASVGMPVSPTSGDVVQAMVTAMELWTLSDEQHAVLLKLIAENGKVDAVGESTDRLGRKVTGLRLASSVEGNEDTVLISVDSGRIVGVESQRTVGDNVVPAGTVVDYRMWQPQTGENS